MAALVIALVAVAIVWYGMRDAYRRGINQGRLIERRTALERLGRGRMPGCTCIPDSLFDAGNCPHHPHSMSS